jgi:hypothetical protein
MERILVDDLHTEWMKEPVRKREFEALDEGFPLTAAPIKARSRAWVRAGASGAAYGDSTGCSCAVGGGREHANHKNPGKTGEGYRKSVADPFRAGASAPGFLSDGKMRAIRSRSDRRLLVRL